LTPLVIVALAVHFAAGEAAGHIASCRDRLPIGPGALLPKLIVRLGRRAIEFSRGANAASYVRALGNLDPVAVGTDSCWRHQVAARAEAVALLVAPAPQFTCTNAARAARSS